MTQDITIIEKELSPIAEQATLLQIKNDFTLKTAVELLSTLNKWNDNITEEKEKITKPLNEALKAERARWKPIEQVYQEAIASLRLKMSEYQANQVDQKRKDEQKIADKISSGYIKLETAVKKIEVLPKIQKEIATLQGLVQFREVKKFEIIDITKLPIEYLLPNEQMIKEDMKNGKELEGVKYYVEQVVINYR